MFHTIKGDLFTNLRRNPSGNDIIIHVVNNRGGWGRGFVRALSQHTTQPERAYRQWFSRKTTSKGTRFQLGNTQMVATDEPHLLVANCLAQDGYRDECNLTPFSLAAFRLCLRTLACAQPGTRFHFPRVGAGLGGGNWPEILSCIQDTLNDFDLYYYEV